MCSSIHFSVHKCQDIVHTAVLLLKFNLSLAQPYHLSLEADSPDELTSDYIMTKIQENRSVKFVDDG